MQLKSLKIRNYRVLRQVDIDFPDRVIGIIGPNGAGKSSLIEAISWALYGNQAARTGKDEIKSTLAGPGEDCEVSLAFQLNGEPYRVVRRLVGKRERAEVELFRGEESESVGVNETKSYVGQLLGLDWRGFLSSFLARQQELNALSDLQPSKRRDHLAGMLGIERLDQATTALKGDIKGYRQTVDVLDRRLVEGPQLEARIEELKKALEGLESRVTDAVARQQTAAVEVDRATEDLEKRQGIRERYLALQSKLEAYRDSGRDLTGQLEAADDEIKSLQAGRVELEKLAEGLERLPGLIETRDRLSRLEAVQEQRTKTILELKRAAEGVEDAAARVRDVDRERESLSAKLAGLVDIPESQRRQLADEVDKAREQFIELKGQRAGLQVQVDQLRKQIRDIESFGPDSVCDRCHRPLGDDLPTIREHLQKELNALNGQFTAATVTLERAQDDGVKLKQRFDQIEESIRTRTELQKEYQVLCRRGDEEARREREYRELAGRLQRGLDELPDRSEADVSPAEVRRQIADLEARRARRDELKGRVARLPEVVQSRDKLAERLRQVEKEQARVTAEMEQLEYTPERFAAAQDRLGEARQKLEDIREERLSLQKELELVQQELGTRQEQLARFKKDREELERLRDQTFYGEKLVTLLGDYRQFLIGRIRPTLAELAGGLMSDMTDGRYSLIELDEQYNLQVYDSGVAYAVERFSGGEKDLANLCLRLAISLALTEAAGIDQSFVILDEVFASQDDSRKDLVLQALTSLRRRFPQILLVTHVEDIREQVEELIEVRPQPGGWSQVVVNGVQQE